MNKTKTVARKGGKLDLCRCPDCGAWHVKAKKKEGEKWVVFSDSKGKVVTKPMKVHYPEEADAILETFPHGAVHHEVGTKESLLKHYEDLSEEDFE